MEDLYQVGLSFVELVISSFSEDTSGAVSARGLLVGNVTSFTVTTFTMNFDVYYHSIFDESWCGVRTSNTQMWDSLISTDLNARVQLSQREIQQIFEKLCDSDFKSFREFVRYGVV